MKKTVQLFVALSLLVAPGLVAEEVISTQVTEDLSQPKQDPNIWKSKGSTIILTAQPMALPRPSSTTTEKITVQSVHNNDWISFRLSWKDKDKSEAGRLGKFSDAVAIQFPAKAGDMPPIFMGAKDQPVHIYHWRAQYELDQKVGMRTIKDLYPNVDMDMYPLEFKDHGNIPAISDAQREVFLPGKAAGNPQSYTKSAVDEIYAEGFGTSAVTEAAQTLASGEWKRGEWTVVISRAMKPKRRESSALAPGQEHFIGFAVWQGDKGEVGARKSVTMAWVPLKIMGNQPKGSKGAK